MNPYACHITDENAPTRKLKCGHVYKTSDERCRGCLRSGMESWDTIMARVSEGWAKRWDQPEDK